MSAVINHSLIAALVSDDVRLASVRFANGGDRLYTYKVPPGSPCEQGDWFVVPTPTGYSVAEVVELDPDVDFKPTGIKYKWLVQRIDTTAHQDLLAREDAMVKAYRERERRQLRHQAVVTLREAAGDLLRDISLSASEVSGNDDSQPTEALADGVSIIPVYKLCRGPQYLLIGHIDLRVAASVSRKYVKLYKRQEERDSTSPHFIIIKRQDGPYGGPCVLEKASEEARALLSHDWIGFSPLGK